MAGPQPLGEPWPTDNRLVAIDGWTKSSFHAYVHVPFCKVRCGYCDFNTYTSDELGGTKRESFHESILREIELSEQVLGQSNIVVNPFSSIFFGGGTPTLFETSQFEAILGKLESIHGLSPSAEITVEANPDTVDLNYLRRLVQVGVNRISFGVQSFDPEVLHTLDRTHNSEAVAQVVSDAHKVGLQVSLDLIYGTPGETLASWRRTLERAVALETNHISAYSLIIEPGTKLANRVRRGELPDIDSDFHADCYELADSVLQASGFDWYEVSNWSRSKSAQSIHNLAYWQSRDWWGYGPGAHSHVAGNRWWNVKHPATYQKQLSELLPVAAGRERLTQSQSQEERLLLELRTSYGVSLDVVRNLGISPSLISQELADGNLRLLPEDRISVTSQGRLVADAIVVRLLASG